MLRTAAAAVFATAFARAALPEWAQCGGTGFTTTDVCGTGMACVLWSQDYGQCINAACATPAASTVTSTATVTTTAQAQTVTATATITQTITVASSTATTAAFPTGTGTALNTHAAAVGKYMGTATDKGDFSDSNYMAILNKSSEFGILTPANSMKWDSIEPQQGVFNFAGGDQLVALAQANGQQVRGHNLAWHSQLPKWLTSVTNWTADQMTDIMQNHIANVAGHYKGQIFAWDVVNEPIADDGTWNTSPFYNALGPEYVAVALRAARAADPNAKLMINDYNLEYTGAKLNSTVTMVQNLLAEGAPLDAIGFEAHFEVGTVPSAQDIAANFKLFTDMGLEVAVTELDVRMQLPETLAQLEQQKADFASVVGACKLTAACLGVSVWDFDDKYSWVPGTFSGWGDACPFDANLVKKPAYDGIIAGFAM